MKYAVLYFSVTGNTCAAAEAIYRAPRNAANFAVRVAAMD